MPPAPVNIKLLLEYDGTHFYGWQKQPGLRTVQGVLENAVFKCSGKQTGIIGAGRTDTGVHARGQVANFKTSARLSPSEWVRALNHALPGDLAVLSARKVSSGFHSRYSATGKTYRYEVLNRQEPMAIGKAFVWEFYQPLNIRAMKAAARLITGRHDFSSFQVDRRGKLKKGGSGNAVCTLREVRISAKGKRLTFTFTGNRFLQQMVRSIVGTLIEVGRGKIKPGEISEILKKKDRRFAGPTVPARGLCLDKVMFG